METQPVQRLVATCRTGLEKVVAAELKALGLAVVEIARRAVHFEADQGGIYRANMALRCALNVLLPIRSFNARNYDMLYYQSRKTNWHKWFSVDRTLRIDLNGGSHVLTHTAYVVHRVKDGIVDTFRKLSGGVRPSIDKNDPDVHVVVHLEGTRATLCLDTSGLPLFKRGYRLHHGEAPLKEDLAAGILRLAEWREDQPLLDPMCGSGTFLFEGWMMAANRAPNLDRKFGFQSLYDYDQAWYDREREALRTRQRPWEQVPTLTGLEKDPATYALMERIAAQSFPEAKLDVMRADFRQCQKTFPGAMAVVNPPYGKRLRGDVDLNTLYAELGAWLREKIPGGEAAVLSANEEALRHLGLETTTLAGLRNGALDCRLVRAALPAPDSPAPCQ